MARQGVNTPTLEDAAVLRSRDDDAGAGGRRDDGRADAARQHGDDGLSEESRRPAAEAFAGGWFHTGDLAVMHPDGYVEIKDRAKDIIISGGENISSLEVEEVLYQHPDVMEAAVVARPDEKWGETPQAFVTLKPDATGVTAADIIAWCRTHLAHLQVPALRDVRAAAEDVDREDPEVRAATEGPAHVGRKSEAYSASLQNHRRWPHDPGRPV